MAAVVMLQARWRRKGRSPLQGSGLDPWAPRREDSKGSEPDSWGDFRSLTEAPIARLESLDEMESLSVSSWQRKPNHKIPPTSPLPLALPALPTPPPPPPPPHIPTHFMHEATHGRLSALAPISVAMFSNALTSIIACITSTFSVSYMYYVFPLICSSPKYSKDSCGSVYGVKMNVYSKIYSYIGNWREYLFFCIFIQWNVLLYFICIYNILKCLNLSLQLSIKNLYCSLNLFSLCNNYDFLLKYGIIVIMKYVIIKYYYMYSLVKVAPSLPPSLHPSQSVSMISTHWTKFLYLWAS